MSITGKHFISLNDFTSDEIISLVMNAIKAKHGTALPSLKGKTLVALFFNPSLRTRISFQVAMQKLQGEVIVINVSSDLWALEFEDGTIMDGKTSEHIKDAARVLGRYGDCIAVRAFPGFEAWEEDKKERIISSFSKEAKVPIVNMESSLYHPCQGLADAMTISERIKDPGGQPVLITWAWHPKALPLSVAHSALFASAHLGMDIRLACPEGYEPDPDVLAAVKSRVKKNGGSLNIFHNQKKAAEGTKVIYAKSWTSLPCWNDKEAELQKRKDLRSWIVNRELVESTDSAFFMHCLPVRRNVVVTDEVLDSSQCAVYDEAENRTWAQMAVLSSILGS